MLATTGTPPDADQALDRLDPHRDHVPDQPEIDLARRRRPCRGAARGEQAAVLPGHARPPGCCTRLIRPTRSRPTWPTSTIRTTSMASGLVTRRPPRNSETMPSRSSIAEICGPPPCTTTGCTPHRFMNTMSWAKACLSSSSTMALPPYLITTVLPA